ncbi:hypothetical protein BKA62DRAFT_744572 [Auriculariales sp. MPI-PUGE-AT-0066]|nr:hypothetical protein BKA62DRAFT_744572 [Auriculariales sp. MPI-PUGE-AT-0066]
MPKVVSRSVASTSTDAKPTVSSTTALKVLYCICGEFILVIDKTLALLPRRETDDAIIIRAQDGTSATQRKAVFKLNVTNEDQAIILDRANGKFGYTNEPSKSAPFFYIHRGALTQIQGQVPPDAFDEEEEQH